MKTDEATRQKPLRLWPGVVAVALQWLTWLVAPFAMPDFEGEAVASLGLFLGGLAIVVWWAFFSRAPRFERWGAVVLTAGAMALFPRFLHVSVAAGNLGLTYVLYAIPVLSLSFVIWAVASRRLPDSSRRGTMAATILLACGLWTLVRSDGITGASDAELVWRWAATPEERLLSRADDQPRALASPLPSAPARAVTGAAWPGFRGAGRSGVIPGLRIETDWSRSPPVELWRRPVGPGVSSFAVRGGLLYTQEQRGEDEVVSSYELATGASAWRHHDTARFWDAHVGAGPRATPALGEDRVYALGATGILNALDAASGAVVWSRNVASDTSAEAPQFGFTSSPLVAGDVVIVAGGGALSAYELATGDRRWSGPTAGDSYSSPHLMTIDEVEQILLLTSAGVSSVAPADGTPLWEHPWPGLGIVQPALTADGDLLIGTAGTPGRGPFGTRRLAVSHGPGGWTSEERWTSDRLKPHFSAFVVHKGHAFGFDGNILASIELDAGRRNWKGGRYGSGQLVLLPAQDLLLVLSERGELALVAATPDRFTELARFPAIEGKTWNLPALVGDVLVVRNREEMAAFRLPTAG